MLKLADSFVSNGSKFFAHEEAMRKLRGGQGQPITTHVMSQHIFTTYIELYRAS